jgi:RHS repeat-associated protein
MEVNSTAVMSKSLNFAFDPISVSRLSMVTDSGAAQPPLEHSYSYDANGSLESLTYSNGVTHNWSYDSQNRLKNLSIRNSSLVILNSYSYTVGASGHRRSITEANGRTVGYTLDNQYCLTQEAISGDPSIVGGISDWSYDLVGNRHSQQSDLASILDQTESYSDNNWLESHTYDANGNTVESSAQLQQASVVLNDSYDWRNRLIRREQSDGTIIEIIYDGFGDRIKKTIRPYSSAISHSTWYQVDRNNLTGYAQVVEEIGQGDELQVIYSYGLDLISQDRRDGDGSGNFTQSFYLYDGLGSIRALTNSTGTVTDTYTYDAWGVLIDQISNLTIPTSNFHRFTGEQWDADLGMYFLRARYLNVATGRFHTMDTFEGVTTDPVTLHKYLYANAAPHMWTDPTGNYTLVGVMHTVMTSYLVGRMAVPSIVAGINLGIQARIFTILKPMSDELSILANELYDVSPKASREVDSLADLTRQHLSLGKMSIEVLGPTIVAAAGGPEGFIGSLTISGMRAYLLSQFASSILEKAASGMSASGINGQYSMSGKVDKSSFSKVFFGYGGLHPAEDIRLMTNFVMDWKSRNVFNTQKSFDTLGLSLGRYGAFSGSFSFSRGNVSGAGGMNGQSGSFSYGAGATGGF